MTNTGGRYVEVKKKFGKSSAWVRRQLEQESACSRLFIIREMCIEEQEAGKLEVRSIVLDRDSLPFSNLNC